MFTGRKLRAIAHSLEINGVLITDLIYRTSLPAQCESDVAPAHSSRYPMALASASGEALAAHC